MSHEPHPSSSSAQGIDPRGPRVGAGITALLLAVTLLLGSSQAALWLLTFIALSFLLGALRGAQGTWQGWVFKTFVRPRLGPTAEHEDPRPPRFAQGVGFVITGVGVLLGFTVSLVAVPVAAGLALVAAVLNAAFGLCLGCEMYLLVRRFAPAR